MRELDMSARVRMPAGNCAPSSPHCGPGESKAWRYAEDDYAAFVGTYAKGWLDRQAQNPTEKLLYVVVSHGAYITASHFPGADPAFKMQNTAIVGRRYAGTETVVEGKRYMVMDREQPHAENISEKPASARALAAELRQEWEHGNGLSAAAGGLPQEFASAWTESQGADAEALGAELVERLYKEALRAWDGNPCQWRSEEGSWRNCLAGSRALVLERAKERQAQAKGKLFDVEAALPQS